MARWVIHSTNSRTRATHCVILNKDLLLVLKRGGHRKSKFSCWVPSKTLLSRSPTPLDQHEKTAGNRIPSHSVALYMQVYRILIHPKGIATFNMSEDVCNSAGGSEVYTTQSLGRICLTVFSCYKNSSFPLIF